LLEQPSLLRNHADRPNSLAGKPRNKPNLSSSVFTPPMTFKPGFHTGA
jgi:hypothetical protein